MILKVLRGDIEEAICSHAIYYAIWQRYGVLPERFNWQMKAPEVLFYPLRPEFAESTYLLYQVRYLLYYLHQTDGNHRTNHSYFDCLDYFVMINQILLLYSDLCDSVNHTYLVLHI